MIDKKSILKMTEHVFRKSKGCPDKRLMHPKREWGIGVLLFVFIVAVGSVMAFSIFIKYQSIDQIVGGPEESIPQYREVIVDDALEQYRLRSSAYEALQKDVVPVIVQEVLDTEAVPDAEKEIVGEIRSQ